MLTGYWQNFNNGATRPEAVATYAQYDIIAVAFADATEHARRGHLQPRLGLPALGGYTVAQFKADIKAKQAAGKKVIISVGGQNGTGLGRATRPPATNFANCVYSLMQTYGFDGVDIDLENGLNPTYMAQALRSLSREGGLGPRHHDGAADDRHAVDVGRATSRRR